MKSLLVHAWTVHRINGKYFLPYTHWVYLNEIVKYYDKVWLMSPIKIETKNSSGLIDISNFKQLKIYELPYSDGYIEAVKHFFSYIKAYSKLSKVCDIAYARYPIPFGWLQMFYFKNRKRIIHFVGDPIDTIINNPNFSSVKKNVYKFFFKPEDIMFNYACKKASVYTNGHHIAEKLKKRNIEAKSLVSSTLNESDFHFVNKEIIESAPKIIYVGYLRKAKGVDTVLRGFKELQSTNRDASLTIVGTGEMENELKNIVIKEKIENVDFKGHVDERDELNRLLREHDIFCFASLSEGSPRVILEAMANGLAVVSTAVGSLPSTFVDNEEILFAEFNNPRDFADKLRICSNNTIYNSIRIKSFDKVKEFTIESFLKIIFKYA